MTSTILITGCSSGIGLHTAKALKQRGYRVLATARKPEDVLALQNQGLESYQLDVTDHAAMANTVSTILAATGDQLSALFNNAGYLQAGAIEDLSLDAMRAQFETNVFGAMALTQLILPVMRKQGFGRIIQNSSVLGIMTIPFYGAYNASKYALEGFSLSLRQELHRSGIHVSLINPGPIFSHLRENAFHIYQSTLSKPAQSLHHEAYTKMERSYFTSQGHSSLTASPEKVVTSLLHALESKRPHAHYYVGRPAKLMALLKRFLPESAFEWVIQQL